MRKKDSGFNGENEKERNTFVLREWKSKDKWEIKKMWERGETSRFLKGAKVLNEVKVLVKVNFEGLKTNGVTPICNFQ